MNMLEAMMALHVYMNEHVRNNVALHVYMNEHVRNNDGVTCLYE